MRVCRSLLVAVIAIVAIAQARPAHAQPSRPDAALDAAAPDATAAHDRAMHGTRTRTPIPTPLWLLTQAIPSPETLFAEDAVAFGLRWQLTPLLYSFGVHRRVPPWRVLVAEPLVRHSGSLELFGAPEYLALDGVSSRWGLRAGLRAYFPVLHRGEYLSLSLGTSVLRFDDQTSMAAEAGVYVLFGILGLQVDASPTLAGGSGIARVSVRYF
ncbi:MAG: hypothetical protein WKG00_17915 [Polyangiaceae bacterium]